MYDALVNDVENLKKHKSLPKNNHHVNQALEEAMMSSQVILGNSRSDEDHMKK